MRFVNYVSLAAVLFLWGASRFNSGRFLLREKKFAKKIFFLSIAGFFLILFYLTRQLFLFWAADETAKYFLPPYTSINYFLGYVFTHLWGSYLVSLPVSILFFWLAQYFNKKRGEIFFEKEEPYFIALALFLTGHPGWVLYLVLILAITLMFAFINWLFYRKAQRIHYYNFWLPLAALAIILDRILMNYWAPYLTLIFSRT